MSRVRPRRAPPPPLGAPSPASPVGCGAGWPPLAEAVCFPFAPGGGAAPRGWHCRFGACPLRPARRPLRRPSCRAPRSRKRVPPTTSRSAPPSATGKPEERSPGSNPPARSFNCTAGRDKGAAGSAVAASCALAPLPQQRLKPLRARAPAKAKSGGCSCCSFWLFPVVARLAARRLSAPWFGRRLTAFFLLVLRWCCGTAAARALMRAPLLGLLLLPAVVGWLRFRAVVALLRLLRLRARWALVCGFGGSGAPEARSLEALDHSSPAVLRLPCSDTAPTRKRGARLQIGAEKIQIVPVYEISNKFL